MVQKADCTLRSGLFGQPGGVTVDAGGALYWWCFLLAECVAVVAGEVTVDAGGWVCSCGDREVMEGVCVLGVAAVIFLLAAAFRVMFRAMPFSFLSLEAFSAGNALLFSGIRRIRYRRGPPTVRNMRAVQKTGSWGTRRIF